ncbi:MAG: proline dehydrogenase family protein [Chloroflexota bacterium]
MISPYLVNQNQNQELANTAVVLAETLLTRSKSEQTHQEHTQAQKIARMMEDPLGKELTIALVDQAFRSHQHQRIAEQLSYLLEKYGSPAYMAWWERSALTVGGVMAQYLPAMIVPPIVARLRQETSNVILPGEEGDLSQYLQERRESGVRLNLNQLGEAILGEAEAARRLDAYLDLLSRSDVEYISVKISSIFSQINLIAFDQTVEKIKDRLRILYRQAKKYEYQHPNGRLSSKFINLDMEEYRDLHLTVRAFKDVLQEEEFFDLRAGIVLQAYLPDSSEVQRDITLWAQRRVENGGAPIKLRIVKGANLAMEKVEAAVHGWEQAPYLTKRDVDANFKRMVTFGSHPPHAQAVHLGVASHNLFDIAYALLLRQRNGVEAFVEFEMLEGMANYQARAVQEEAEGLLLYAPVVKIEDFHSAIAYLVRRLDENTAEENFLHDLFGLEVDSPAWVKQKALFLESVERQETVRALPNRQQNRLAERPLPTHNQPFENCADTDFSLPANQEWVRQVIANWQSITVDTIPLQIGGEMIWGEDRGQGIDPSRPSKVAYTYALADREKVDRALETAVSAQAHWQMRTIAERKAILIEAAAELEKARGDLMGAMMLDAGKTIGEADPEISEAIDFANYYARAFDRETVGGDLSDVSFTPVGVVVVTPPWNFPLAIPAGGVLSSLIAGNAVILKPAPEAVLVGWQLANVLWKAGVPKDVLQFVPAPDNEIGQSLVTDNRVGAVILTGSSETAKLFQSWKPGLNLFAETSGKNSLIVTAMADRDQAIKDLVKSAFGHNGQKCSAASLAILEAEVYDDEIFRRQLKDAVSSLAVGANWDSFNMVGALTQPPSPQLGQALCSLEEGETWLLQPQMLDNNLHLWTPGIKLGVKRHSFFHQTECFGPVLGLMRAKDLDNAIEIANEVSFGLTSGIHSLDDREVAYWKAHIQAGNLYINRHITGAIVRRQPFGGWKASVVGPGAKAGGPNYVLQLGQWQQKRLPVQQGEVSASVSTLLAKCVAYLGQIGRFSADVDRALNHSVQNYAYAWQNHFAVEHDPSQVLGEDNIFRYRDCPFVIRIGADFDAVEMAQLLLAARTVQDSLTVSVEPTESHSWEWLDEDEGITLLVEDEVSFGERLERAGGAIERVRLVGHLSQGGRRTANAAGVAVLAQPVLANGRLELRHYLREQAVSHTTHRYGNLLQKG